MGQNANCSTRNVVPHTGAKKCERFCIFFFVEPLVGLSLLDAQLGESLLALFVVSVQDVDVLLFLEAEPPASHVALHVRPAVGHALGAAARYEVANLYTILT